VVELQRLAARIQWGFANDPLPDSPSDGISARSSLSTNTMHFVRSARINADNGNGAGLSL